jgi:hypothetical protein
VEIAKPATKRRPVKDSGCLVRAAAASGTHESQIRRDSSALREEISTNPDRKPVSARPRSRPSAGRLWWARGSTHRINLNTRMSALRSTSQSRFAFSNARFRSKQWALLKIGNQAQVSMNHGF